MKPLLHSPSNQPTICFRAFEAHIKAKIPQNASSEIFLRNSRGRGEMLRSRLLIKRRACIPKVSSELMTLEKDKGTGRQAQGQKG